jgi:hypothetical protein
MGMIINGERLNMKCGIENSGEGYRAGKFDITDKGKYLKLFQLNLIAPK